MDSTPISLPLPFKHSIPQARNNVISTPQSRSAGDQTSPRRKPIGDNTENHSPGKSSAAFEGMLRTSTETGDIGLFSIKPSRIPQALGNPRSNGLSYLQTTDRTRHNFQPYGVPLDDRRRLPSYARSSSRKTAVSLYRQPAQSFNSSSQSSPSGRSYSLTQSAFQHHGLASARSFSSLRSQVQQHGTSYALQRPRSPFAYPTRLRRPGVRPSSPALTDGGIIDYSRRAEIERSPRILGGDPAALGTAYANQRRNARPLRRDATRSTPSLLGPSSPTKRTSTPSLRQTALSSVVGPNTVSVFTPMGGSPTRSTHSTISLLSITSPPIISPTRSSTQVHSPSPLYYDYTENFASQDDAENRHESETPSTASPTLSPSADDYTEVPPILSSHNDTFNAAKIVATIPNDFDVSPLSTGNGSNDLVYNPAVEDSHILESYPESLKPIGEDDAWDVQELDCRRNTTIVQHSGLGHVARELSTHIEEADCFSEQSSPELQGESSLAVRHYGLDESAQTLRPAVQGRQWSVLSTTSSAQSLGTKLQKFPNAPFQDPVSTCLEHENTEEAQDNLGRRTGDCATERVTSGQDNASLTQGFLLNRISPDHVPPQQNAIYQEGGSTLDSSRMFSKCEDNSVHRLDDCHDLLYVSDNVNEATSLSSTLFLKNRLILHLEEGLNVGGSLLAIPPRKASLNHETSQPPGLTRSNKNDVGGESIFTQTISKTPPRLATPMLAPKAISPARQLRLKNSVPHLMKALPPLPMARPNNQTVMSSHRSLRLQASMPELSRATPSQYRRLYRTDAMQDLPAKQGFNELMMPVAWSSKESRYDIGRKSCEVVFEKDDNDFALPPQRLRLKTRGSSKGLLSQTEARPWNSEESYPWTADNLVLVATRDSETSAEHVAVPQLPRFQVKLTRASSSSQETMVINRASAEVWAHHDLPFTSKDLFTPPVVDLESYFQDIHIQSHPNGETTILDIPQHTVLPSSPNALSEVSRSDHNKRQSRSEVGARHVRILSTPRAQSSFSDDSSNMIRHSKLRTRLSNLKSKMSFQPSGSRGLYSGSENSLGDRTRNIRESTTAAAINTQTPGSNPKLRWMSSFGQNDMVQPKRRGLRGKIKSLLEGARNTINHRRKKSKTSIETGEEEKK